MKGRKRFLVVIAAAALLLGATVAVLSPHLFVHRSVAAADQRGAFDRLPIDRELNPAELRELHNLCDLLIDRRKYGNDRWRATHKLGMEIGHKYCIPALLAVLRDQTDREDIRQGCVKALSRIQDKRVIDYLIEALPDQQSRVAFQAEMQLYALTGQRFVDFDPDPQSPARRQLHQQWCDWWKQNRETATIRWGWALGDQ